MTLPKLSTLTDDFNGVSFDTAKWTAQGSGSLAQSGGAISLTPPTSTGYEEFFTTNAPAESSGFTLYNSYIFWQARTWPDATSNPFFALFNSFGGAVDPVQDGELYELYLNFDTSVNKVRLQIFDGGLQTYYHDTGWIAVTLSNATWWRIKDDPGGVITEYAPTFSGPWTTLFQAVGIRGNLHGGVWPEWQANWVSSASPQPWIIELINTGVCYPTVTAHAEQIFTSTPGASFSFTCSGTDRLLLVAVASTYTANNSAYTVTFNGTSVPCIARRLVFSYSALALETFALVAPAATTGTLSVTLPGAAYGTILAMALSGVHQTTPFADGNSQAGYTAPGQVIYNVGEYIPSDYLIWQASSWNWQSTLVTAFTASGQFGNGGAWLAGQDTGTRRVYGGHGWYPAVGAAVPTVDQVGYWQPNVASPAINIVDAFLAIRGSCLTTPRANVPYAAGFNTMNGIGFDANSLGHFTPMATFGPSLGIVQLSEGTISDLALASDGKVYGWGDLSVTQISPGDAVVLPGLSDEQPPHLVRFTPGVLGTGIFTTPVQQICAGYEQNYVLLTDGTLYATGKNDQGQLGTGDQLPRSNWTNVTPSLAAGRKITQIYAGWQFAAACDDIGDIYVVGQTNAGVRGDGTTPANTLTWFRVPSLPKPCVQLSGNGQSQVLVYLASDGTAYWWGSNGNNTAGNNYGPNRTTPTLLGVSNIKQLAMLGFDSAVVLNTGDVKIWGANSFANYVTPTTISLPAPVATANKGSSNYGGVLVLQLTDGTLWTVGDEAANYDTPQVFPVNQNNIFVTPFPIYPGMFDTGIVWQGESSEQWGTTIYPVATIPVITGMQMVRCMVQGG